jgi:hypothetical protein
MKEKKIMTNNDKKVFGEDKLGRLVRLMKRYEEQLQEDGVEPISISLRMESDGSGTLIASHNVVYDYLDTEGLFRFLESGQLARTLMSRG